MVKQKTIDKYTKFIGKDFGCIHVDDIDLSNADKIEYISFVHANRVEENFD